MSKRFAVQVERDLSGKASACVEQREARLGFLKIFLSAGDLKAHETPERVVTGVLEEFGFGISERFDFIRRQSDAAMGEMFAGVTQGRG